MRLTPSSWALAAIVALSLSASGGCVGPSRLRRGLDENRNQLYVDNPSLAQCLAPIYLVGEVGATVADGLFINPIFWWKDALAGHGTPYFYRDPVVPAGSSE